MNFSTKVTSFYLMYGEHTLISSSFSRVDKSQEVSTKMETVNDLMERIYI